MNLKKIAREKHDIYYRKSKEEGWRARSAFKLMQIDDTYSIFKGVKQAVDLCSAPGSWSQVLQRRLLQNEDGSFKKDVIIVSVDLQEMQPIEGINIIQGDITLDKTKNQIIDLFHGTKAQLVICDGAPDVTGFHDIDEYVQAQLLSSALTITSKLLEEGGSFTAKIFLGPNYNLLKAQLEIYFELVYLFKPASSRIGSGEHFVVCKGFKTPDKSIDKLIIPYLECGDLSGYDDEK